jgi:anti-anti-sigma factor
MMTDNGRTMRQKGRLGRRRPEIRCRSSASLAGASLRPRRDAPPGLAVTVVQTWDDTAVVIVGGEIDLRTSDTLRTELFALHAAGHRGLVLDCSEVGFCDASGLGALVAAHNRVTADGGRIRLARVRPQQLRLLCITGLDRVFPVYDDITEAIAHARTSADSHS